MDGRSFDILARALGGAVSRRAALGALAGLLAGGAGLEGEAKRKRRKCDPACAAGQTCRQGTCTCDNGGTACGASCCALGQRCEGGTCVVEPARCIPSGERCKDTGRLCCDGLTCASGQGGQDDIACYAPAGGACATTADCVFDSTCRDGVCVANPRPAPAPACMVCPSGCPYSSIQAAIDAATDGATITVAPGTYTPTPTDLGEIVFYLSVKNKAVKLERCGAAGAVTVQCPDRSAYIVSCLQVDSGQVEVDGFAFVQSGPQGVSPSSQAVLVAGSGGATAKGRLTNVSTSGFSLPISAGADGVVTINGGVSVTGWTEEGLSVNATNGTFVCNAPVAFGAPGGSSAVECEPSLPATGDCGCSS